MTTLVADPSLAPLSAPSGRLRPPRILSVDILRALIMFMMVFVNDTAGVDAMPWWAKHFDEANRGNNGMTFVDVVFGAFLCVVGISIPLAVEGRRAKGESWLKICLHILLRTAALLLLGVLMVDGESISERAMGWHHYHWEILLQLFSIVTFLSLPLKSRPLRIAWNIVRVLGLVGLLWLGSAWRNKHHQHIVNWDAAHGWYLLHDWWGILGLIGWAYLAVCLIAIPLRFDRTFMALAVALLTGMFIADKAGGFDHVWLSNHIGYGGDIGSQGAITMAGAMLGTLLLRDSTINAHRARIGWAMGFAVALFLGGLVLYPSFGISKNDATPTWCLFCASIVMVLWAGIYAVVDVAGFHVGVSLLAAAGANVLLTYLLHPLCDYLPSLWHWHWLNSIGDGPSPVAGIAKGLVTAAVLTTLAGVCYRGGVRMRL